MSKKNLGHLLALLMVAMLSIGFASCSSDDDDGNGGSSNNVKTKLLGTWKMVSCSSSWYSSSFKYINFKNDGTCLYSSSTGFEYTDLDSPCKWTYNEESKMLRMYTEDGYYKYNLLFEFEDNGDWSGTEVTGSGNVVYIYTRYTGETE